MIRALILAGDYLGGDPMPEEELAARLEVSRTPVREALKRLQAEGFVEKRANRRVFLAELHLSTVVEIFVVRARLEPLAARLAASRVDSAFLTLLQDCIDRMDEARLAGQNGLRRYRQVNEEFHWEILKQSENGALDSSVRGVARRQLTSPTFHGWTAEEMHRSQEHHRELVAAFRIGDPDWAEAVMTTHLYAARATYHRISKTGDRSPFLARHLEYDKPEPSKDAPTDNTQKSTDGE